MDNEMINKKEISEGWKKRRLVKVCKVQGGFAFKSEEFLKDGVPLIKISNINDESVKLEKNNSYVSNNRLKFYKSFIIKEGDILIALSGATVGKIGRIKNIKLSLLNQRVGRFMERSDVISKKYLFYTLLKGEMLKYIINNAASSAQPNISPSFIENFKILFPSSLTEQCKIAEILETVDETIKKTDAIIEKHKRIKQGLMQDLFGNLASYGGSVEKLIKERIILEIQDGNHGEKHPKITDFIEDGIPFIMASDITENQINFNTCHHISEKQYNSLRIGFAKKNDVLLSHKASVGFTAIVPNKRIMLTPQVTYYRIANKNVLLPEYLFYYFQSKDFQKKIKDLAKQSTRDYIGIVSQRKNLEIYFPKNLEKQKEIINILSKIDLIIQKEKKYKEKLKRIKQGLMEDLLTGKVRVNHLIKEGSESV